MQLSTGWSLARLAVELEKTMPKYVYQGLETGSTFELEQRISEAALTHNPETGEAVKRLIGMPAISFKGSGFYANDSKASGSKSETKSEGTTGEAKSEPSSGGSDSSKTSSGGDSSSATTIPSPSTPAPAPTPAPSAPKPASSSKD
jgi:predicted nucleic acid-binding Zn ribbon protein